MFGISKETLDRLKERSQIGGFILQLNITNFNNYSSEDITELTNEIMATAGAFAQRKGVVFA